MAKGQSKLYRLGQKQPGGKTVTGKPTQGIFSKSNSGKTHAVKGRSVNHNRGGKK